MKKELVILRIQSLLSSSFGISEVESNAHLHTSLFLEPFNLDAITMTYFFLMLENVFEIELHPDSLESYKFTSIDVIASLFSE